jgi:hypothetical protein
MIKKSQEGQNILQTVTGTKANWTGHILNRNCLLKHVNEGKIEGRIEVTERRERKHKHYWTTLRELQSTEN